jgi:hypothetical protein
MAVFDSRQHAEGAERAADAQFTGAVLPEDVRAWEQIDSGRYMPRRIRGSFKGRALG